MADIVGGRFSEKIAKKLGFTYHPLERRIFPDTELQPRIKIQGDLGNKVYFILRPKEGQDFNAYLIEFLVTLNNLKNRGIEEIHAIMPYMIYARQDERFREGEPLTSKIVGDLIKKSGADSYTAINVHLQRAHGVKNFFDIPAYNLTAFPILAKHAKENYNLRDPFILAPDDEALKWAETAAGVIETEDYDAIHKERDFETGEIETKMPDVDLEGRDVIIIDDIISTGGTMRAAIRHSREKGAEGVIACAVHPVLVENALEKFKKMNLKGLFCANTLRSEISKVDVRGLITQHIKKLEKQ